MKKTGMLILAVVLVGAAVVCGSMGVAAIALGNTSPDGNWVSQDNSDISLVIKGDSISGNSGINQYFGNANFESNGKFVIGSVGSTMMAGPEDKMDAEQKYLAALGSAVGYKVDGDKLVLLDADGKVVLTFVKDVKTPVGNWTISGTDVTLSINEDGSFNGQSYVNLYFGNWDSQNGLKFQNVGSTMMAGPEDAMASEQSLFESIANVENFDVNDGVLTLLDAEGNVLLTFESA